MSIDKGGNKSKNPTCLSNISMLTASTVQSKTTDWQNGSKSKPRNLFKKINPKRYS